MEEKLGTSAILGVLLVILCLCFIDKFLPWLCTKNCFYRRNFLCEIDALDNFCTLDNFQTSVNHFFYKTFTAKKKFHLSISFHEFLPQKCESKFPKFPHCVKSQTWNSMNSVQEWVGVSRVSRKLTTHSESTRSRFLGRVDSKWLIRAFFGTK